MALTTYLFGCLCEAGLFSKQGEDSFNYLLEIEPDLGTEEYDGDAHYDEGKEMISFI